MEYKLPPVPVRNVVIDGLWEEVFGPYDVDDLREYAELAVFPLLAEIEHLENLLFEATQYDDGGANVQE